MTHDASALFKNARSLWFPVSVNAAVLGTLGVMAFHGASWILASLSGNPSGAAYRVEGFLVGMTELLRGRWPGDGGWVFIGQLIVAYVLWARLAPAIARITAVRVAKDHYITLAEAVGFSRVHFNTTLLHVPAIALPAGFCAGVVALIGAIAQLWAPGWIVGALLLPVAVLCTAMFGALVAAGVVSFLYFPAAVAIEGKRTYDGLGKTFNYLLARPFSALTHLVLVAAWFWVLDAWVLGDLRERTANLLGLFNFIDQASFRDIVRGNTAVDGPVATAIAFVWSALWWVITCIVHGALISWALAACTSSWLILRQDIDGNELTQVVDTAELAIDPSWETKKD